MAIKKSFVGAKIYPPSGSNVMVFQRPRTIVEIKGYSGGRPCEEQERVVDGDDKEFSYALVQYKSMEQLIKENPQHFYDCYGNFNTGTGDHLAPSYFGQMGKTAHRRYERETGIKDEWYYTVIDR